MLAEIFAPCDHGPLISRVVGGVVTAPVGFSMFLDHRGIMPRLPIYEKNDGWASPGYWLNTEGLGNFRFT